MKNPFDRGVDLPYKQGPRRRSNKWRRARQKKKAETQKSLLTRNK